MLYFLISVVTLSSLLKSRIYFYCKKHQLDFNPATRVGMSASNSCQVKLMYPRQASLNLCRATIVVDLATKY